MPISMRNIICILVLFLIIPSVYAIEIERLSVSSTGDQANSRSGGTSLSADGRFVVFNSRADNLVAGDTNGQFDVFVIQNNQLNIANDLSASLRTTSGAVQVGEYSRFRARLTNTTD